ETGNGRIVICQYRGQSDIALKIADLDNHLITLFRHEHFVHFDMRERQAENVGIPLLGDLLYCPSIEDLGWILLPKKSLCKFTQLHGAENFMSIVRSLPDG